MAAEMETVLESPEFKEGGEVGEDMEEMEMEMAMRGCCFWIPCLDSDRTKAGGGSAWWERIRTAENKERWWSRGWKKVREWSEIAAGPKWKTFIRRFNRNNKGGAIGGRGKFQYDPLSYSLNFDHGPGQNGDPEDDFGFRDFSSRYAAIPISAKSSMDLGKDAPSFI